MPPKATGRRVRLAALLTVAAFLLTSCGTPVTTPPPSTSPPAVASPSPSVRLSPSPSPTPTPKPKPEPDPPSLKDDRRNAFAFAPLDDPSDVTVEGRVGRSQAWSTSKVLVVAAFLKTVGRGDPDSLSSTDRRRIKTALTESDEAAVTALRDEIPGRSGSMMTSILRSIGDRTTTAPDSYQGLMRWSIREQVRFMAALAKGEVVNGQVSAFLLDQMHPIKAHAWGLGTIGATAYKGGWLRADTVTRQMGIVDGYAVAIITDSVGPAVRQTDGDSAHVKQMNRLAELLQKRLEAEQSSR